jgi:hypothetical protein
MRFQGLAVCLAALVTAACSGSGSITSSPGTGRVQFVLGGPVAAATAAPTTAAALTDEDGRRIDSATISLSSLLARNLDGELVAVTIDLPVEVDLVDLLEGRSVELPTGALPAGSYDQLVVVIRSLTVTLSDGTQIDVTPPGGGWTAIVRTEPFDVVEGEVTTVSLRFRPEGAFRWFDGHLEFHPEFDCDVDDGDDGDDD